MPAYFGSQPGGASSNVANSKPGATVQPTRVQSPSDSRRLPGVRGDDPLRTFAGGKVVAERDALALPGRRSDLERQRRTGVPVPDFDRIDAMPVRALAARQQKIDRRRGGAAAQLPSAACGRG